MNKTYTRNGFFPICDICKKEIIGDYEYVKTRRKNEFYFHPDCNRKRNKKNKELEMKKREQLTPSGK